MQQNLSMPLQQEMMRRRLPWVVVLLVISSGILVVRMISFQAPPDPRVAAYIESVRQANYGSQRLLTSPRGLIYDRNGQPLAVNTLRYRIGVSPSLISNQEDFIQNISAILERDPLEIRELIDTDAPYRLLAANIEPEVWRRIDALNYISIKAEQIPRRYYPQNELASHIIGLVGGGVEDLRGYNGVEGYYQELLIGQTRSEEVSNLPFDVPDEEDALQRGADLVLTIDRDVQYLIEQELAAAVQSTGAQGGTIIVMNPRTGDILGMANYPTFNANEIRAMNCCCVTPRLLCRMNPDQCLRC